MIKSLTYHSSWNNFLANNIKILKYAEIHLQNFLVIPRRFVRHMNLKTRRYSGNKKVSFDRMFELYNSFNPS